MPAAADENRPDARAGGGRPRPGGSRALPYEAVADRPLPAARPGRPPEPARSVLFAARSAAALHRLLDTLPVFGGDDRVRRRFTLVPGSDFGPEALAALDSAGARTVPWAEAVATEHHLVLAASPKGPLEELTGPLVLLPHGAGFNKTVDGEGARDSASGLDPAFLLRDGRPLATRHALAHPSQAARLAERSEAAARRARIVGDPTLDRILESLPLRERYREALGTGDRTLSVLVSTWGPEALLERRAALPFQLAAGLPVDGHQLALVAHPNVHSERGRLNLVERLPAGMPLADPYEEWAALLIASDVILTDHGSTALYGAVIGRPVVAVCDGGAELLPGTPMARLLEQVPRLSEPELLPGLVGDRWGTAAREAAEGAFAHRGTALARLRTELYEVLGMTPPSAPAEPRLLPVPRAPRPVPAAHAVRVLHREGVRLVERRPPGADGPLHHLAAEADAAHRRYVDSSALLYVRAASFGLRPGCRWTVAGWTRHALETHPACRTAAVVLAPELCVVRRRDREGLLTVRICPVHDAGRVYRADPAAVLSAVHAGLARGGPDASDGADVFRCRVGPRTYPVRVGAADAREAEAELRPMSAAPAG